MLYLLGKNYSNLDIELFLSVLGGCVSMMVGIAYALSLGRTWVVPVAFNVTSCIVVQAVLIFLLDFSTARGVLVYGLLNSIWVFAVFLGYLVYRIFLLRKHEAKAAVDAAS